MATTTSGSDHSDVLVLQVKLIQEGVVYGFYVIALVMMLLACMTIPFLTLGRLPPPDLSTPGAVGLGVVVIGVILLLMALIGVVAAGLHKLIPLYLQYGRARQQDEEMFL